MNLKLNKVEDDAVDDEEFLLSEPRPRPEPSPFDLLTAVVIVVFVGIVVWLLIVSTIDPVSA